MNLTILSKCCAVMVVLATVVGKSRICISNVRGCYWSVMFIGKDNKSVRSVRKRKQCFRGRNLASYMYTMPALAVLSNTVFRNRKLSGQASLRKKPTFGGATTDFPTKWRLRNEHRNSILITRHYPDLGSASDWSCCVGNLIQPIRSTTQIWVVTRHQCGISALVSQTSFGGETKCRLFSQAKDKL